ncbi:MAG: ribonuclease J [Candidatus Tokpelaia sp. JSC161]|jgi:ribonuclease J|nr:MAG: ribonuclease J [Candidatus Tokpelaia sp. JSC161]
MVLTKNADLLFLPLGGVGEIGMNLAVYGYGAENKREWLIIDMGVCFAGSDIPGANLILPDISFLEGQRHNISGLVLTHAHEDHFGAVPFLWPKLQVPIYCTAFTAALLENRREGDFDCRKVPLNIFRGGEKFHVGSYEVESISVAHSIPDSVSLSIRTPLGTIIHTGDWKIDEVLTDEQRFRSLGEEGVLALVCDSTNALCESSGFSEAKVAQTLQKILADARGCVAISTFASNVARIKSIALAADTLGKRVLLLGRSMKRTLALAEELGYLKGIRPFLDEEDYELISRDKVVLLLTGSQGEPQAALAKLARNEKGSIRLGAGDILVFSSRNIPGNEKAILNIQNSLIDQGVQIITDRDMCVHVSGHPYPCHLKQMYRWVNPKILIPVHGEASHLVAHAALGKEAGIQKVLQARNGRILRLAPGEPGVIDQIPMRRIYKDGNLMGDEESLGISTRRKLSYVGHVVVSLFFDGSYGLAGPVKLILLGLPKIDSRGRFLDSLLLKSIENAINNMPRQHRKDHIVCRAIRKVVSSLVYDFWGKKTIVDICMHHH